MLTEEKVEPVSSVLCCIALLSVVLHCIVVALRWVTSERKCIESQIMQFEILKF